MARILDKAGWPIQPGARVERYSKSGHKVKQDGVVVSVETTKKHPEGVVHYTAIGTMNRGVTSAGLVRVMPDSTDRVKRTEKMKRYDFQKEVTADLSAKVQKLVLRGRRVASPRRKA